MAVLQLLWSITVYTTIVPAVVLLLITSITYIFTSLRYRLQLWQYKHRKGQNAAPVMVPYALPFIGNAFEFLTRKPGYFWNYLLKWHPRTMGTATLMMGGRHMHLLFDPHSIQAMFKAREPTRDSMNLDVVIKGLGVDTAQAVRYYGIGGPPQEALGGRTAAQHLEHINTNYLLRADRVNELTAKFMELLQSHVSSDLQGDKDCTEVGLYSWLRTRMFKASTVTFFGSTIVEGYPDLEADFFEFDVVLLACYFGIPRWVSPRPYELRDKLTTKLAQWQERTIESTKGQIIDPDGDVVWESNYGSRINRIRQDYYNTRGLTIDNRARFDLGMLFGISSNAIPATGWMLTHILDPNGDKTIYPRVMQEIEASKRPDGSIDPAILVTQPLLLSMVHEVLRLYVDVLVTRELPSDLTVPVGTTSKLTLGKGSIVVAPSWIDHREDSYWEGPPADTFYAERFLSTDPASGKAVFSTASAAGKYFPYGGGKTICPGRTFAKQEILGSLAIVLSEFDFEGLGYIDAGGKATEQFPGFGPWYPGSAVLVGSGDLKVRIKRKN